MNAFIRLHWRVAVLAVASVVLLGILAQSLAHLLDGKSYDDGAYDAKLAVARAREHTLHHERDSMSVAARVARVVYVAKRRDEKEAVAALPPATIVGDSLTLPTGVYVVQHPVAVYIGHLQAALGKADSALFAADTALLKTVAAQEKSDSLSSASSAVADLAVAEVEKRRPGFFARTWNAIRMPVFIGVGFAAGVLASKAAH